MKKWTLAIVCVVVLLVLWTSFLGACIIGNPNNPPTIIITNAPTDCCYGSWAGSIQGSVNNVNTDSVAVVLYAQTNMYWVQPYDFNPWTSVGCPGGFFTNSTHGGHHYCAILVKKTWNPPDTIDYLPPIGGNILAIACWPNPRAISFAGYVWQVKQAGDVRVDPGLNYWSDSQDNVWVDAFGKMHLKLTYRNGKWYCPEVFTDQYLGYGYYRFEIEGQIDQLDQKVVLGCFSYSSQGDEIDIEFSRWDNPSGPNGQYVVQPWTTPGNRYQFPFTLIQPKSNHEFIWQPDSITFVSNQGGIDEGGLLIQWWTYKGASKPTPDVERMRFNIWLLDGVAPVNGQEVEIVISNFKYCVTPASLVKSANWGKLKAMYR